MSKEERKENKKNNQIKKRQYVGVRTQRINSLIH